MTRRLVVGITGATGAVYGLLLLRRARALGLRTHLIVTPAGVLNAHHELGLDRKALEAEADVAHAPGDVGACVASGRVKIPVNQRYALADVVQAHRDLESRKTTGTTVLLP